MAATTYHDHHPQPCSIVFVISYDIPDKGVVSLDASDCSFKAEVDNWLLWSGSNISNTFITFYDLRFPFFCPTLILSLPSFGLKTSLPPFLQYWTLLLLLFSERCDSLAFIAFSTSISRPPQTFSNIPYYPAIQSLLYSPSRLSCIVIPRLYTIFFYYSTQPSSNMISDRKSG